MTDRDKRLDEAVNEIDLLDFIGQQTVVHVQLPSDPTLAGACVKIMSRVAQEDAVRRALQPIFDQMMFDIDAAQRGAMPPPPSLM